MTINEELRTSIEAAVEEAKLRRHEYLMLEHLLYALCADAEAVKILKAVGVRPSTLVAGLEAFFEEHLEALPDDVEEVDPTQTIAFWRVLQRAAMQVRGSGKEVVETSHVLISMLRESDSHAAYLIGKQGATRLDVVRYVSHGVTKVAMQRKVDPDAETEGAEDDTEVVEDPLEAFTVELTERAAQGQIDPLVGRRDEVLLLTQALARRRKNNPVLVGDSGVGKTAIVEGLALAIHEKRVPDILEGVRIYALNMGVLLAGTKFRGEFEERLKGIMERIVGDEKAILFIDEIHTIVGAGATSGGSLDASNLLKPALASGQLRCIGSTTYEDYRQSFEKDRALARRFQKIEIVEPTVEDTIKILEGLAERYQDHHGIRYTKPALRAAAELSAKYINERKLPDKAIDVIDQAGAANRMLPASARRKTIGAANIEAVVALMAKIPEQSVSADDQAALADLDAELKAVVFGQDQAIEQIASAIKLQRAGLGHPDKPIGSFLFSGPTGVGKTELAKQLANVMGVQFVRFDMSEYMEKHTVSRLIGAPPGYVGFDQGGLLTDAIRRNPYTVLLLDEIEKAHPDLFNILLQVMDHATLTDNTGRKADFRHVVLIMTTNAGGRDLTSNDMGFSRADESAEVKSRGAIERMFSPEFRNRLDAWVAFEPLPMKVQLMIVDKLVQELNDQLSAKGVAIELTKAARQYLAKEGYSPDFGARPMARLLSEKLKKPLADRILFGDLQDGGTVKAGFKKGELTLDKVS